MKYMHKNKLVPPTSTYGQGNHAPTVRKQLMYSLPG